jgi:hypothetical protein
MSFYLSQPPSSWLPACQNTNNDKFKNKWVYYRLWQSNQMFNLNFNTESISIIVSWHNGITHCLLISSTKKWAKIPNTFLYYYFTIYHNTRQEYCILKENMKIWFSLPSISEGGSLPYFFPLLTLFLQNIRN